METLRNFEVAVRDGLLIDVSHLAARIGLLCPTFITPAFWNSVEVERSEERVLGMLDMSITVHDRVQQDRYGIESFHVDGGPACPWCTTVTALVDRFEGYGTVVVIGDYGETLDFRLPWKKAGGSLYIV